VKFATIWRRDVGDIVLGVEHLLGRRGVVVASRRIVRAYDLDGEMRWRHGLKGDFRDFAPLPNGDIAVIDEGLLSLLNSDGDNKVEMALENNPVGVLAGESIILLAGNEIRRLDLEGESLGKAELDLDAESIIRFGPDFMVSTEDSITKIDPEGGVQWKKDLDLEATSMAAAEDSMYLASGREVLALDRKGETVWKREFQDHVKNIDAEGVLLVITEGEATFLDLSTHESITQIHGDFSLGKLSGDTVVLASDKTVGFHEDVGDVDVFYEIMCRGEQKCGTFVSSEFVNSCPKCGAGKIIIRVEKKKLDDSPSS
jgi:hypothetical protein